MDNDFLLLTIYDVNESRRLYEHQNGVELSTIRMFLERVLDQLSPEQLTDLRTRSVSAMLNDEVLRSPTL